MDMSAKSVSFFFGRFPLFLKRMYVFKAKLLDCTDWRTHDNKTNQLISNRFLDLVFSNLHTAVTVFLTGINCLVVHMLCSPVRNNGTVCITGVSQTIRSSFFVKKIKQI